MDEGFSFKGITQAVQRVTIKLVSNTNQLKGKMDIIHLVLFSVLFILEEVSFPQVLLVCQSLEISFSLGRSSMHVSFTRLAKKYGPIMSLRLGSVTSVVVSSPEIAREILQKHDEVFCDRAIPDAAKGQANFHISMVWLPAGNRWRMLRQAIHNHLTHKHKLDSLVDLRHKAARELVEHVKNGEMSAVAIGNLAFATALNQMSNVCFSQNVGEYESKEIQGFMKAVKTIMHVGGKFNISDLFPWLTPLDPQGIRGKTKEAYDWLEARDDVFLNQRRDQIRNSNISSSSSIHDHDDLLHSFMDCGLKDPDFNTQQLKVLLIELMVAGSDSTSITAEWVMAKLLLNPDIMKKLRQEITEIVGTKGKIEEIDILNLPYLEAVIKETMRLRLAVPLLMPYKSKEEVEVNGYVIPRNTQTFINAWAIARDPSYWEVPEKFIPERFLNSTVDFKGQHFCFIPFGAGRRICPGMPVAHRMVSLIVASLVYHFDWKLPRDTTIDSLDMDDLFGITLPKVTPLLAVPTSIN
ncbi:cytochrome P450 76T24-like [Impatiens glandulifera]|uniref:cytochrome P450 76T24-like n=1 Tax=Impatiens glandulifera TaxID=253017 RepID=UPI001FB16418|nr:cytochrome P450 76T24-like [Impatiens glandulifera]